MALSTRQEKILAFVGKYRDERGYPPTIREIQEELDISSTSVVDYHLKVLQREGYLERDPSVSRGMRLTKQARGHLGVALPPSVSIPVLGLIAAGEPIPVLDSDASAFEGERIDLTRDILRDAEGTYALQVSGDSMIDALVNDGDIVIMKRPTEVRDGDMVAAWLKNEQETTLKRVYREGDRIRLQPANPNMAPIYIPAPDVEIQGKVVLVVREL
ncbi:MAG: transcriptional repressor LexA [Chloroflexota bacterium]|nr:transcriptional repressor LexA [Chloroflexota bacterium]